MKITFFVLEFNPPEAPKKSCRKVTCVWKTLFSIYSRYPFSFWVVCYSTPKRTLQWRSNHCFCLCVKMGCFVCLQPRYRLQNLVILLDCKLFLMFFPALFLPLFEVIKNDERELRIRYIAKGWLFISWKKSSGVVFPFLPSRWHHFFILACGDHSSHHTLP